MRYAVLDGCPCPRPLFPILRKLQKETGARFNSIYRGEDVADILHRNDKSTQAELYAELGPGIANPPDRGTHILRGDGTVGELFARLPWWRCGIDVNDEYVDDLIAAARKHGWTLYRPYKSGAESHHLNFARKPRRWRAFFRNVFGPKKPEPRPQRPERLSKHGAAFIAEFEGFRGEPYNDPAGHATIGYGHLLHHGEVTAGDRRKWIGGITRKEALQLLREDAQVAERAVLDLVDVALNQNQFDALVSFTYNLGAGALAESTLLRKLNRRKYRAVPRQLLRWVNAGGEKLPGLVRRRRAEGQLFNRAV